MKNKYWAGMIFSLLLAVETGCGALKPVEVQKEEETPPVPVITRAFASPEIRPGSTWKIYLIAADPRGKMKYIVSVINQPGVGQYPVSLIRIRPQNREELNGYIYLNTLSRGDLNFVNITLTVQIQDTRGNYSQPAIFPLSFNNRYRQEPPPPGVFEENNLGPIMIQLRTIENGDGRGHEH